jgi:lysozyme family protein
MAALPRATAVSIYRTIYWQGAGLGQVAHHAPQLAAELFDTAVNMGVPTAIGFLQRSLNALNRNGRDYADIAVDKALGPATIAALARFLALRGPHAQQVLIRAAEALQGARYISLAEARPANEAFLYGWLAHRIG